MNKTVITLSCILIMIISTIASAVPATITGIVTRVTVAGPNELRLKVSGLWYSAMLPAWRADLWEKLHALGMAALSSQREVTLVNESTNMEIKKLTITCNTKTPVTCNSGTGYRDTYLRTITVDCADTIRSYGYYTFTTNCKSGTTTITYNVDAKRINTSQYNRIFSLMMLAIQNVKAVRVFYSGSSTLIECPATQMMLYK